MGKSTIADDSLLNITVGHDLNDESLLVGEGHACTPISLVARIELQLSFTHGSERIRLRSTKVRYRSLNSNCLSCITQGQIF